jgi:hypothetical protein
MDTPVQEPNEPQDARTPGAAGAPAAATPPAKKKGINWFRFWMQMLAVMIVFNIVAGLITWYYIFPILHPAR